MSVKDLIVSLTNVTHTVGFGRGRGRTPAADRLNVGTSSFSSNSRNSLSNNYDDNDWNDNDAQTSGNLYTPVFRGDFSESFLFLRPAYLLSPHDQLHIFQ